MIVFRLIWAHLIVHLINELENKLVFIQKLNFMLWTLNRKKFNKVYSLYHSIIGPSVVLAPDLSYFASKDKVFSLLDMIAITFPPEPRKRIYYQIIANNWEPFRLFLRLFIVRKFIELVKILETISLENISHQRKLTNWMNQTGQAKSWNIDMKLITFPMNPVAPVMKTLRPLKKWAISDSFSSSIVAYSFLLKNVWKKILSLFASFVIFFLRCMYINVLIIDDQKMMMI